MIPYQHYRTLDLAGITTHRPHRLALPLSPYPYSHAAADATVGNRNLECFMVYQLHAVYWIFERITFLLGYSSFLHYFFLFCSLYADLTFWAHVLQWSGTLRFPGGSQVKTVCRIVSNSNFVFDTALCAAHLPSWILGYVDMMMLLFIYFLSWACKNLTVSNYQLLFLQLLVTMTNGNLRRSNTIFVTCNL